MYQIWLEKISKTLMISPSLLENMAGTMLVLFIFTIGRSVVMKSLKSKLSNDRHKEMASEILPTLFRLLATAILLKIWLEGQASVASFFAISASIMNKIVASLYVYLFYVGSKLIAEALVSLKYHIDDSKQYTARRSVQIAVSVISAFFLFKIWVATTADFSTYLGLVSAGLAIALKDVIVSLVGWTYLMTVRPFQIGERIQLGEHRGDVIDIKLFQFSILETGNWVAADQPTGRILHFPNSFVFNDVIANYNTGFEFIFSEMPITFTFESHWRKAQSILEGILKEEIGQNNEVARSQIRRASRTMRLSFTHLNPKVITSVADSGVTLTLRFLCHVRERRATEEKLWSKIIEAFEREDDIDFAYPTRRVYNNHIEGKPGAGGPKTEPAPQH